MAVLVRGMEMPKAEFGSMIVAIRPDGMVEDVMGCYVGKAVPVPEPHGRLIDVDALIKRMWDETDCMISVPATFVRDAPTIIPASEEGEA